jgi:hypothetical protein
MIWAAGFGLFLNTGSELGLRKEDWIWPSKEPELEILCSRVSLSFYSVLLCGHYIALIAVETGVKGGIWQCSPLTESKYVFNVCI